MLGKPPVVVGVRFLRPELNGPIIIRYGAVIVV